MCIIYIYIFLQIPHFSPSLSVTGLISHNCGFTWLEIHPGSMGFFPIRLDPQWIFGASHCHMGLSENVGLIFPMIASHFSKRDNDQQNHWVQLGVLTIFSNTPISPGNPEMLLKIHHFSRWKSTIVQPRRTGSHPQGRTVRTVLGWCHCWA